MRIYDFMHVPRIETHWERWKMSKSGEICWSMTIFLLIHFQRNYNTTFDWSHFVLVLVMLNQNKWCNVCANRKKKKTLYISLYFSHRFALQCSYIQIAFSFFCVLKSQSDTSHTPFIQLNVYNFIEHLFNRNDIYFWIVIKNFNYFFSIRNIINEPKHTFKYSKQMNERTESV